ncbi:MAG: glycosyltransferase [Nostoc sp.]|uniref:glycosyltransferase family 2 protein n=1 Tax=Nostoc sp. TaxID=1180 RepID=UPI002FF81711
MNQPPLFSVIIPTYHRNDLLTKCLNCLAPGVQTLPTEQYEVIVTDDGSQTTAEEMIRQQYPWVKWVAGPRKGPAANRNNGAKFAQGEWLAFTDDDCLPKKEWLESFALSITSDIYVYEGKTTCEIATKSPLEHSPINLTGGYLWSCNMMIQKKILLEKLKGFDENFPYPQLEDVDLRERIKLFNYSYIIFVQDAVIDHPPKQVPWGRSLAKLHESHIYYWHKIGIQENLSKKLIISIINFRIRAIVKYPFSLESIKATISLIIELIYTLKNLQTWNKKYKIID